MFGGLLAAAQVNYVHKFFIPNFNRIDSIDSNRFLAASSALGRRAQLPIIFTIKKRFKNTGSRVSLPNRFGSSNPYGQYFELITRAALGRDAAHTQK